MKKVQSRRSMLLLILVYLLLATCICISFFAIRSTSFFTSSSYSNYLWSLRIARELNNLGYPVHAVRISESKTSGDAVVDIQIGNLISGKPQRTYELVKKTHEIIVKTHENSSYPLEVVSGIVITVIDYSSGSYVVGIDFETAKKYQHGEISDEEYFEQWSFPSNTPEIAPP